MLQIKIERQRSFLLSGNALFSWAAMLFFFYGTMTTLRWSPITIQSDDEYGVWSGGWTYINPPRLAPTASVSQLFDVHSAYGSVAFEDTPGVWRKDLEVCRKQYMQGLLCGLCLTRVVLMYCRRVLLSAWAVMCSTTTALTLTRGNGSLRLHVHG